MGNYSPLIALIVPGLALLIVVLVYARRRQPPARKLGQVYSVNAKVEGYSGTGELSIREGTVCFLQVMAAGQYTPHSPPTIRVPLARVRAIRVRYVGIAIEYEGLEGPDTLLVITREQGAKDRLLWELAVLVPAAVEAGIPEGGSVGAARGRTPLPPTGHAASTSEPPDAVRAVLDLDARMTSLGSALAGPVDRPAPPPPRSGLGTGLFVASPRPGDE